MISQTSDRTLYQKDGIDKWIKAGARGYFEWCTGSGKSYLACLAIKLANEIGPPGGLPRTERRRTLPIHRATLQKRCHSPRPPREGFRICICNPPPFH